MMAPGMKKKIAAAQKLITLYAHTNWPDMANKCYEVNDKIPVKQFCSVSGHVAAESEEVLGKNNGRQSAKHPEKVGDALVEPRPRSR